MNGRGFCLALLRIRIRSPLDVPYKSLLRNNNLSPNLFCSAYGILTQKSTPVVFMGSSKTQGETRRPKKSGHACLSCICYHSWSCPSVPYRERLPSALCLLELHSAYEGFAHALHARQGSMNPVAARCTVIISQSKVSLHTD